MADDTPETESNGSAPNGASAPQQQISQRILAQYIRDLSFENVLSQKGAQPDAVPEVSVQVNLDARKRGEDTYEVVTKLKITSKAKGTENVLFLLEIEYAGMFEVKGVAQEQLHAYLMIECPRMTFPFLRRIVSDMTRDGGFPAVNLETIDFVALYRAEIARRLQAQKAAQGETPTAEA
ncbi:protein-export chaperone SecB [Pseudoroseicyclus tamaricis]|uniref:Protein-export protein SecB n=1 Tax=Pseudoroseicyclus tamaricis TaxID=2705421 RepID=A0A6B2JMG7_9RHOB|nr:protein-export chaperone SecB [Pseudoroseicyclus tamaricis]NDV02783.1 protein-export chaperone SecB [Pseudoroseicyclus tamaricis]